MPKKDEEPTVANPSVCLACKFSKHIKTGVADHVYCTKNDIPEDNNGFNFGGAELPPALALMNLDHRNFIGIAHRLWDKTICKEKTTVTLNIDFQIPNNCDYKFEHTMAGTEEGIEEEEKEDNG